MASRYVTNPRNATHNQLRQRKGDLANAGLTREQEIEIRRNMIRDWTLHIRRFGDKNGMYGKLIAQKETEIAGFEAEAAIEQTEAALALAEKRKAIYENALYTRGELEEERNIARLQAQIAALRAYRARTEQVGILLEVAA